MGGAVTQCGRFLSQGRRKPIGGGEVSDKTVRKGPGQLFRDSGAGLWTRSCTLSPQEKYICR